MRRNKKGTEVGASMPKKGCRDSKKNQDYSTTILDTSLIIFVLLMLAGQYFHNDNITSMGLAIGAFTAYFQSRILLREEE